MVILHRLPFFLLALCLFGCQRQIETSLGPEALWVHHTTTGVTVRPALQLETRIVPPDDHVVGVVSRSTLSFHDPQIVPTLADWYTPDDSTELRLLKTVLLIPGLASTPIIGSKTSSGYGMRVRLGKGPLAVSIEGGVQAGMWAHFSQKVLPFDFLLGGWSSTQLAVGKRVGLGLRATYDVPLFHRATKQSTGIIGGAFVLSFVTKPGRVKNTPPHKTDPPPTNPDAPAVEMDRATPATDPAPAPADDREG